MSAQYFNAYASAAFGLEGLVSAELKRLGMEDVHARNGGVRFKASLAMLFLCNLRLRFCDRVFLLMAEGPVHCFEDLFQLMLGISWEQYFSGREAINITCKCSRSDLMSPRACQSVSKKAFIERIERKTNRRSFSEDGADFPIHILIQQDQAMILLNLSGDALSRRGYRTWNGEAPLRETLASAMVELSPWRPGMPLYDPCCGTGTILVEAAFREAHRAPGLMRSFAMESFSFCSKQEMADIRASEKEQYEPEKITAIAGSDIDESALGLAEKHVRQAGLEGKIGLKHLPLQEVCLIGEKGVFLCNPPYGERLGDRASCQALYHDLAGLQKRHPGWHLCAISADPSFERAFGRKADRRHRLYNGRLECTFYTFYAR